MPIWLQHLLVLLAVMGCISFIVWQGVLALRGRKSKLSSCGSCKSCGTETKSAAPAQSPRTAIIPADLLRRRK
jgi:hypothetical protein